MKYRNMRESLFILALCLVLVSGKYKMRESREMEEKEGKNKNNKKDSSEVEEDERKKPGSEDDEGELDKVVDLLNDEGMDKMKEKIMKLYKTMSTFTEYFKTTLREMKANVKRKKIKKDRNRP